MTWIGVLGPVMAFTDGGRPVALGGPKDRAALTLLALSANRARSEAELVDAIWGEDPPSSAGNLLKNQVFRLRKALEATGEPSPRILTRPGGYELAVEPGHLDLLDVEALLDEARRATQQRRHDLAAELLGTALERWRGEPLADLGDLPFVSAARQRLDELRIGVVVERFDAALECGRHAGLLDELEVATATDPLHEGLWLRRLLAMYRAGRAPEALRLYQRVRTYLGEELGLEPSPALAELERAIVRQDPSLDWRPRALPSGVVTFLATDIEQSTQLFHLLGDGFPGFIATYERLLVSTMASQYGVEVRRERDSSLFAFSDASLAVAAAVEAQRVLASHDWPAPVRTRMALHTATVEPTGHDYVALAVHHVERLSRASHGGQVLLSAATIDAMRQWPEHTTAAALGEHVLRDFLEPECVFQLLHPDLTPTFPPLRSTSVIQHNVPRPRSRLIGRAEDISEVRRLLDRTGVVTIVGPGGVGKTRLAIEVATAALPQFADGVWLVELGSLVDGGLVGEAIADTLGVDLVSRRPTLDLVVEHLLARRLLLVLDNCEHLLDGVAKVVEELVQRCSRLAVLATSREALRVDGEAVWRLAPLRAPAHDDDRADLESVAAFEAVQLFCDRSSLLAPDFALDDENAVTVAEITARLDGIPLAIELAASRLAELSVADVEAGLADRFDILVVGRRSAPPRQQTLWATIDWSYQLLDPADRTILDCTAVFAGPFDLAAAAAVVDVGSDEMMQALERLCRRSLVEQAGDRYRLLETIRAYISERLNERADADTARARHLAIYTARAEEAEPHLRRADPDWLERLHPDQDNHREALHWGCSEQPLAALGLALSLCPYWDVRGFNPEGLAWLERLQAALDDHRLDPTIQIRMLLGIAEMTYATDNARCAAALRDALDLCRVHGDDARAADAMCSLGLLDNEAGRVAEAEVHLRLAVTMARATGDTWVETLAGGRLATVAYQQGRFGDARDILEPNVRFWREQLLWQELAWSLAELGQIALVTGDAAGARARLGEALEVAEQLGYRRVEGWARCVHGLERHLAGDLDGARRQFATAAHLFTSLDDRVNGPWPLNSLSRIALDEGNLDEARALFREGLRLVRSAGPVAARRTQFRHAAILVVAGGDAALGARLLGCMQALAEPAEPPVPWQVADLAWVKETARRMLGRGDFAAAVEAGAAADADELLTAAGADPVPSVTMTEAPPRWTIAGGVPLPPRSNTKPALRAAN
jgi:predicted ATPase/DNA-binding SARP family transcriptional activator/predicted negative regulator of RcsB-dependent stress response